MTVLRENPAPATDVFIENMAALWAVDTTLARQVDAIADPLVREPARSGGWTVAAIDATDAGHGKVYLHSRYDPRGEAEKHVADAPADTLEAFVFGLGLGYAARAVLDRAPEATVWLFEPDVRVILAALETVDFSDAITRRRARFVTALDKSHWFTEWMPHLASINAARYRCEHAPSRRLHPTFFTDAAALVDEFLSYGRTTINTLLINSRRTCENLTRNAPWYAAAEGIGRLKGAMAGKPAIIVSAGPSLRKNKHLLKDAADRAVVIAVQTTFQQLIDLGVEPDFVTSLDYHDICTQFFRNIPAGVRTELVAEPKATPKVFDLHPGPLGLLGNAFIDRLLAELPLDRPRLPAGATVAHLAFYLAEHLGCDPIIFVGQDLGFSDGLAYTPGTSYDELWRPELGRFNTVEMLQWQRIVRDRHILRRVPDYRGRPTYTEERLYSYLQQFERDFARTDRHVIDATEGGVAKSGTTVMSLAEAMATHCGGRVEKHLPPHRGLDWSRLDAVADCLQRRIDEADTIERISEETLPLLRELQAKIDQPAAVGPIVSAIDAARVRINGFAATYDLITQLGQRSELDRFLADRRIAAGGISGVEKQRRQLARDLDNVTHIGRSAADFRGLVSACLADVRTMRATKGWAA